MRLDARLERLITVQQKGFHRDAVEAFVFLGCYAYYVGYLPTFWNSLSVLDRLNLKDSTK
jgi:hypothetical protein